MIYIPSVTSLGGVNLRPSPVWLRLPPEHSFSPQHGRTWQARRQHRDVVEFQQVELRSTRLPTKDSVFALRYRLRVDLLACPSGLEELSYSHCAFFERNPRAACSRLDLSPDRGSLCQVR